MCVSPLQYDSGMKSLAQVNLVTNLSTVKEDSTSYEELLNVSGKDKVEAEFKIQKVKPGSVCRPVSETASAEGGALRKRKGEEGIEEVITNQEVSREVKDPLKWFGILVPQTLRRSQQCFVQGMHVGYAFVKCVKFLFSPPFPAPSLPLPSPPLD